MTQQQPPGRIKDISVYRDSFIGMVMLTCTPFLILADPVYPWWAAAGMLLVWAFLLSLAMFWFMRHPRWLIYLALASYAMWFGVVLLNR